MIPSILLIGDSIAFHYQPYLKCYLGDQIDLRTKQGYREALEDLNHPRGANCGDSSQVLAFLTGLFQHAELRPNIVLFNCGLHDIKMDPSTEQLQVEPEAYRRNLEGILAVAKNHAIRPLWITTTPVDDFRHRRFSPEVLRREREVIRYNAIAAELMEANEVATADLHRFTRSLEGDIYTDHVHYTEEVRRLQAGYLAGWLRALGVVS